jgi:1-acyl-sn-glycerol-3-phosphate acyltransferase
VAPEALRRATPLPLRVYRSMRASLHLAEGLATTALVFPWIAMRAREALIRRWSVRLLRILRVEARLHGRPVQPPGSLVIVANHISWLDIFVLNALRPARFIAKAELAAWPFVGRLIASVGTLFIDRTRRRDALKINRHAAEALARGDVIAVFPEGTTSDGRDVLPFHGSLLQPIVDACGHVQPVAIRYRTPHGEHTDAPGYVGDTTFPTSFWRVVSSRALVVELHLPPPVPAGGIHRRKLARAAEDTIRAIVVASASATASAAPAGATGPGTRDRHPA